MLEALHIYEHGLAVLPVMAALKQRGFFEILSAGGLSSSDLCDTLTANSGHMEAALRALRSLGWLSLDETGAYTLTGLASRASEIPDDLVEISKFPFDSLFTPTGPSQGPMSGWTIRSARQWGFSDPLLARFMDGLIAIPLLLAMKKAAVLDSSPHGPAVSWARIPGPLRQEIAGWFLQRGWADWGAGEITLTPLGQFMVERAGILETTASYRPMFARVPELLFGDCGKVFDRDARGHETHVDRTLNVAGSGFQHKKYFDDVRSAIISLFEAQPIEHQPRYVADMGCGDGRLLKAVYEAVREGTSRGQVLDRHPLTLIGTDVNDEALESAAATLQGLPHVLLVADIGDPQQLIEKLRARKLEDPDSILHVRSFLDHNRPYAAPLDLQEAWARPACSTGVWVDPSGHSIPGPLVVANLVEHLTRWAGVTSRHGLILLEVHCLSPAAAGQFLEKTESLHFDLYHALSGQYLVEADTFLLACAEAGLFPKPGYSARYPRTLPFSRITLDCFETRPYRIRQARLADMPRLLELEQACWPEHMRASAEALRVRVADGPGGQLVLEMDGSVAAVLYSQRIADFSRLRSTPYARIAELRSAGGGCVQLLGINADPAQPGTGFGDHLLEFALDYFSRQSGVESIGGVTRCGQFAPHAAVPFAAYVAARNEQRQPVDPILRFHWSHGATLEGPVVGYRPEDTANAGHGVLIQYQMPELLARAASKLQGALLPAPKEAAAPSTVETVGHCIKEILGRGRAGAYAPGRTLRDMGLDSLDLMELTVLLGKHFGQEPDASFFFRYTTPEAIASHFGITEPETPHIPAPIPTAESASRRDAPAAIAIVGIGCRFPQHADGPKEDWHLLRSGTDAVGEVPDSRTWSDNICTRAGGFLDQVDCFDADLFGISPREAVQIDPQQRLLLEVGRDAIEDAGIDPQSLAGTATGVFVGVFNNDYERLQAAPGAEEHLDIYFATGNARSVAAGRLAYMFGLEGPALTVDTACSSSLVAVHLACRSLRTGESTLALAGGVNLMLSPDLSIAFSRAKMLSPEGRCKTFDVSADGYVRSEGCGIVLLKRLEDALRDGDRVYAVVRGSAVNQDGASNGLTAPSVRAQQDVIRRALEDACLDPGDVSYLEAHGTGTALGDPVEFSALEGVFAEGRSPDRPLVLGSVKTNIGHTESAGGVAGLIKLALALDGEFIPAHLHYTAPNPHIDLTRIPAVIPTQGLAWKRDPERPRRAGVSSFGFSGTNSHVIVEEAPATPRQTPATSGTGGTDSWSVLPLSAAHPAALEVLIKRYLDLLGEADPGSLDDICYTAATGRTHFAHRVAFVASSIAQLRKALSIWEATGANAAADEAPLELRDVALRYQAGETIDWQTVHHGSLRHKVALPTYPYRRTPFWIESPQRTGTAAVKAFRDLGWVFDTPFQSVVRIPHSRSFVLDAVYDTDRWPFLRDHPIFGTIVTPAALQVLVALAAAEAVKPGAACSLRQMAFTRALLLPGGAPATVQWLVNETGDRAADFEVLSLNGDEWIGYASGHIAFSEAEPQPRVSLGQVRARCLEAIEPAEFYARLADREIRLGPAFQILDQIYLGKNEVLGSITPVGARGAAVPAAIVDACFQLALARHDPASRPMLPFRIEQFDLAAAEDWNLEKMWGHVQFRPASNDAAAPGEQIFDSFLSDGEGRVIARALGVHLREAPRHVMLAKRPSADLYQVSWQAIEWPREASPGGTAPALILGRRGGFSEEIADGLRLRGERVVLAFPGDTCGPAGDGLYQLRHTHPEDYVQLLEAGPFAKVVFLWGCEDVPGASATIQGLEAYYRLACGSLVSLVQALAQTRAATSPRLWVVGRGLGTPGSMRSATQAPLMGLAGVIGHEHPELRCVRLHLPQTSDADRVVSLLQSNPEEDWLSPTADALQAARLTRYVPENPQREFRLRDSASYLITGGLGALGIQVAQWAAARGARSLILAGRHAPSPDASQAFARLRRSGVAVAVEPISVADPEQLRSALERAARELPAIRGVFHLAGIVEDRLLAGMDWDRFFRVMEPKVLGAWNLHHLTVDLELDHFVLFSSIASLIGTPGQGNYAAANAFLDGLARFRQSLGLAGLSINWGAWSIGMAARLSRRDKARWSDWGLEPMDAPSALELLEQLLISKQPQVGAVTLDWSRYLSHARGMGTSAFLSAMRPNDKAAASVFPLLRELGEATTSRQLALLEKYVRERVCALLALPSTDAVQANDGFFNLGADSLMAMELKDVLDADLGLSLRSTVAFDFPTSATLAAHLRARLLESGSITAGRDESREQTADPRPASVDATLRADVTELGDRWSEPIAIIGSNWRLPGSGTPDETWRMLRDGVHAVRDIPADRWDVEAHFDADPQAPGKMNCRHGGFLDHIDQFDPLFFKISPREAAYLDPQQRLLLEVAWNALEDANVAPSTLQGSATGVFVGISTVDYGQQMMDERHRDFVNGYMGTGGLLSPAAGRLSYALQLHGPSMAVDTACSSSLVALHLACMSLRAGECDQALVGGVNVMTSPGLSLVFSKAHMLSPSGACRTFDAGADGYVRGEGCAVVVIKRLADALRDGDEVQAVVLGSAINQDGGSSGLTVPNGPSQEAVIRQSLARARIEPNAVDYVEAHGTGTPLGDPIEAIALGAVYGEGRTATRPLFLGSIKTNIGHLEAAAGLAGVVKVLLALRHGEIPPHLHYEQPSPLVPWHEMPLQVVTERTPWMPARGRTRIAGVSSFGFAGTNAHVILGEAAPTAPRAVSPADPFQILTISAASQTALSALRRRYADYLTERTDLDFADVCYTARHGRSHLPFRLSVIARSATEAAAILSGSHSTAGLISQEPGLASSSESQDDGQATLTAVGELYVRGGSVDWQAFDRGQLRRRVPLPAYPFDRQRYWIERRPTPAARTPPAGDSILGTRLRSPYSGEIRFESTLNSTAPWYLSEHRLFGAVVVPAAYFVGMAIAAVQRTTSHQSFTFEDVRFPEALTLPDGESRIVQLILRSEDRVPASFQIVSCASSAEGTDADWTVHASGRIQGTAPSVDPIDTAAYRARAADANSGESFYQRYAASGYAWGPGFRWIDRLWDHRGEAFCRLLAPPMRGSVEPEVWFPGLIDSWFHLLIASSMDSVAVEGSLLVPVSIATLRVLAAPGEQKELWAHLSRRSPGSGSAALSGDLRLFDAEGAPVADMLGFQLRRARSSSLLHQKAEPRAQAGEQAGNVTSDLRRKLTHASAGARQSLLYQYLEAQVRTGLDLPPGHVIDPRRGFAELGMDSLLALELRDRLGEDLAVALPATLVFDYATLETLTLHLLETAFGQARVNNPALETPGPMSFDVRSLSERELEALVDREWTSISGDHE